MATGAYGPIVPYDLELVREGTVPGIEAASQSYKKGSPLIDSSGKIATAGAAPAAVLGIAFTDATGTTNKPLEYWPIKAGRLYEITFNGTIAQTDINTNVGIVKDATTGYWYCDSGDTGDQVTIKMLSPGWAIGDTKPRVLVTFDAANIQGA
jgi:hypothetical protein